MANGETLYVYGRDAEIADQPHAMTLEAAEATGPAVSSPTEKSALRAGNPAEAMQRLGSHYLRIGKSETG